MGVHDFVGGANVTANKLETIMKGVNGNLFENKQRN